MSCRCRPRRSAGMTQPTSHAAPRSGALRDSLRGWFAPLMLAAARARRRPARWLLPALGIALAAAFAAGVAAESQIASDESARSVLDRTSPLATEVRVTWQGAVSPGVADQARALLRGLGLGSQTEVVLMNPVRLGGVVVRPAAIAPLGQWLPGTALGRLGPCRPERCPMLLAGASGPVPSTLAAIGVRIQVVGSAPLRSAVPLGFVPSDAGAAPVLVTTDVAGLESLPGLSGLYRTYSWLAPLAIDAAARVAAGRRRGPAGPLAGPPAAGREPVQPERAVHHTGRSACRGERGAAAAAARGRRRDRGAGAVHRPGRRRSSPRSAGRAGPAPQRRRPYASLRPVRHGGIRMAVRSGAECRRGRRDRGRGAARAGPRGNRLARS